MNVCTQEKPNTARVNDYNASAPATGSYAQWNNDWKRETESGSDPPRFLAFVLLLKAAHVSEQRRKRERRQIE